jgi:hypothetical protein
MPNENPVRWEKEAIYDKEINPLVAQIMAICDREKLPFIISVCYQNIPESETEDQDQSYCTSYGPGPGPHPDPRIFAAFKVIRAPRGDFFAMTVTTPPPSPK